MCIRDRLPIPTDEEHLLPPRERTFEGGLEAKEPAAIKAGDKQFFDDPISGPKFSDKQFADKKPSRTRAPSRPSPRKADLGNDDKQSSSADPWAKWK